MKLKQEYKYSWYATYLQNTANIWNTCIRQFTTIQLQILWSQFCNTRKQSMKSSISQRALDNAKNSDVYIRDKTRFRKRHRLYDSRELTRISCFQCTRKPLKELRVYWNIVQKEGIRTRRFGNKRSNSPEKFSTFQSESRVQITLSRVRSKFFKSLKWGFAQNQSVYVMKCLIMERQSG